jgi:hypothetical protein
MLVNRDQTRAYAAPIAFQTPGGRQPLAGPLRVVQYSSAQYAWLDRGESSRPARDLPPARFVLAAGRPPVLPPLSLTIVSGAGPAADAPPVSTAP